MEPAKMENFHLRLNSTDQIYQDSMYDTKSIFWQVDDQPCPRAEVICPQPRRTTRIPHFMQSLNRVGGKPKSILPIHRVDCASEILDLLLSKDGSEGDSDSSSQVGFFCGSPPARTNNPVVHDSEFGKQSLFLDSPKGISPSMKQAGICTSIIPPINICSEPASSLPRSLPPPPLRARNRLTSLQTMNVDKLMKMVVQASIAANTWIVSGSPQMKSKKFEDLLPGIINQLGPDNLENLKRLA
ncbi:hypothetical protein OPV22_015551 [Ensete ventricosum]|uniref:Uncharacterized protein n=1 Tax=Ensete ventricosum TaxID=4639 RepID=A0AAV8R451_ENSVE|nr:hypothetical protein OPV22_015551 [Ensete ventricosum]